MCVCESCIGGIRGSARTLMTTIIIMSIDCKHFRRAFVLLREVAYINSLKTDFSLLNFIYCEITSTSSDAVIRLEIIVVYYINVYFFFPSSNRTPGVTRVYPTVHVKEHNNIMINNNADTSYNIE